MDNVDDIQPIHPKPISASAVDITARTVADENNDKMTSQEYNDDFECPHQTEEKSISSGVSSVSKYRFRSLLRHKKVYRYINRTTSRSPKQSLMRLKWKKQLYDTLKMTDVLLSGLKCCTTILCFEEVTNARLPEKMKLIVPAPNGPHRPLLAS